MGKPGTSEAAIADLSGEIEPLLEHAPEGVIILDESGIVRYANPAAAAFLETEAEQLLHAAFGLPAKPDGVAQRIEIHVPGGSRAMEIRAHTLTWRGVRALIVHLRPSPEQDHETRRRS